VSFPLRFVKLADHAGDPLLGELGVHESLVERQPVGAVTLMGRLALSHPVFSEPGEGGVDQADHLGRRGSHRVALRQPRRWCRSRPAGRTPERPCD
jgi:hypothetical protein